MIPGLALGLWKLQFRLRSLLQGRAPKGSVPEMAFRDEDGGRVSVSDRLAGKVCGLLWMTNLCEDCRARAPFLQELFEEFGGRMGILAVSVLTGDRETPARVRRSIELGFGLLEDPGDEIGTVLGFLHPAGTCPMFNLLLFDAAGRIRFKTHLSAVKNEKLREEILKLVHPI